MRDRKWTNYFDIWLDAKQADFLADERMEIVTALTSCSRRFMLLKLVWERLKEDFSVQKKLLEEVFPRALQSARGTERKRLMDEATEKLRDPELMLARDNAALKVQLDLEDLWLHARILMDEIAFLTTFFLKSVAYRSFTRHRHYFLRKENIPFDQDEEYASYIREKTGWFDSYLRTPRDKLIAHPLPLVSGVKVSLDEDTPRLFKSGWGRNLIRYHRQLMELRQKYLNKYPELAEVDSLIQILEFFNNPDIRIEQEDYTKVVELMRKAGAEFIDPDSLLDYLDEFMDFFTKHFSAREVVV